MSNLKAMARMATFLEDEVRKTYPEFPLRKGVLSWEDNLPPLSKELADLVEAVRHGDHSRGRGALSRYGKLPRRFVQATEERGQPRSVARDSRRAIYRSVPGGNCWNKLRGRAIICESLVCSPVTPARLLGNNSIHWVALDLALMAEGAIVVPLYARQAPAELAGMMKDCGPRFFFVSDAELGESVAKVWPECSARHFVRRSAGQKYVGRRNRRRAESA